MARRKVEKPIPFKEIKDQKERMRIRRQAYKIFTQLDGTHGYTTQIYKNIANKTGMSERQVEVFRKKDKWDERLAKDRAEGKFEKQLQKAKDEALDRINSDASTGAINKILEKANLPHRYNLFILYYLQSFNVIQSALKIGCTKNSASSFGWEILRHPKVKTVIKDIREVMYSDIYIGAHDVINEYIKVAFSDITDYVEFEGDSVRLKASAEVDGRMIMEVKQGRDGITIKMQDKMKALDKLERLFEIIPDRRLRFDREKFEWTRELAEKADGDDNSKVTIINDLG